MSNTKCVIFFEQEIPLILAVNIYGILTEKFQECLWRHCQDSTGHQKLICDKQGEDYSTCRGPSSTLNPSFPPFPTIKSHKSRIFSSNVFLSSSLWEVLFGGPETLKLLLRNKFPATPEDFRTRCSSSFGATIHPSYPSFNSGQCNPGM